MSKDCMRDGLAGETSEARILETGAIEMERLEAEHLEAGVSGTEHLTAGRAASSIDLAPSGSAMAGESERVLHSLYTSAEAMMGVVELADEDLRFLDCSPTTAKFLRRSPEEIHGKRASELGLDEEARQFWVAQYRECRESGRPLQFERLMPWTLPGETRSEYWLCITISYIGPGDNGCARFTFLAEDISARKQIQQSLEDAQTDLRNSDRARRKANKRVATILDSIHDAYLALDRNWIITYTNGRAEDILRRPRAQLIGLNFWDVFPVVRELRLYDELQRAMSKQAAVHFHDYYPHSDRWLEHNIYPAQDGLFLYARDVTAQHKAQEELQQGVEKLQRSLNGFVQAMSRAVDIRDPYTAGHQRRVSALATRIAQQMGQSPDQVEGIRVAGLLHDIGKIAVPAEILSRPGKLTPPEISLIQAHAQIGHDILKDIEFATPVALIALQHHERLDGSGYPQQLRGNAILPESRLLAVADVVEAMASHRPYRAALGLPAALEEVLQGRNVRYDADVVDACFELFRANGFDFEQTIEA